MGDENFLCHYSGSAFMTVHICQNSSDCIFKMSKLYINYTSEGEIKKKKGHFGKSDRGVCHGSCSGKMICTSLQVQDSRIIQQAFLLSRNTLVMASIKVQSYILLSGLVILFLLTHQGEMSCQGRPGPSVCMIRISGELYSREV